MSTWRIAAATFSLALAALARPMAWAAEPVAFVADARGDVTLNDAGRPTFLAELSIGARLSLGTGATAAVMYVVSGAEYDLKGPGEFSVGPDGVKASTGAAPSRRISPVRTSTATLVQTSRAATASLRMRGMAPGAPPPGLRYPVEARVATLEPTLRWDGDPNAGYLIEVADADGTERFRGNARGASLRLPVKLAAARSYRWRCTAGERVIGEARFQTLGQEAIETAERARASARGFTDRVALAMLLQDLGASQDARETWAQLAAERPDIAELGALAR